MRTGSLQNSKKNFRSNHWIYYWSKNLLIKISTWKKRRSSGYMKPGLLKINPKEGYFNTRIILHSSNNTLFVSMQFTQRCFDVAILLCIVSLFCLILFCFYAGRVFAYIVKHQKRNILEIFLCTGMVLKFYNCIF